MMATLLCNRLYKLCSLLKKTSSERIGFSVFRRCILSRGITLCHRNDSVSAICQSVRHSLDSNGSFRHTSYVIYHRKDFGLCSILFSTKQTLRAKHTNKKDKNQSTTEAEGIDSDDEATSAADIHFKEHEDFPSNYRDMAVHMKAPRLDAVIGHGLGLNRRAVEDYFYGSKLRLNGEKVVKKGKQLQAGDAVDVILSKADDDIKIQRVRLVKINEERSVKNKVIVHLRAWRGAVTIKQTKKDFNS